MIELKLIISKIGRIITIFELDESLLEPCEVQASRTVLRRVWGSNSPLLSDKDWIRVSDNSYYINPHFHHYR